MPPVCTAGPGPGRHPVSGAPLCRTLVSLHHTPMGLARPGEGLCLEDLLPSWHRTPAASLHSGFPEQRLEPPGMSLSRWQVRP